MVQIGAVDTSIAIFILCILGIIALLMWIVPRLG
jgi:hypothetical protein